jgi:hypothetical protein
MKKILFLSCFLFSVVAFGQTKQDTIIDQQVQPTSGNYIPKKALNPVLHEMLGNRVTAYGSKTLADEVITFTGIKVKFGNSAEIGPLSGSDTLTAPDANPLNFRIDLLVVNRNGTTAIITGSPGEQGIDPSYDVANQIPVWRITVNDRGVGTVTPVTYATLAEVRAGVLSNVALSPSTYMTVTQELIDEALAGILTGGSGGHILKNNGTTLTQRGTLQVLSNATIMRDSSATGSSILDLRDYIGRFGGTRPWSGQQKISDDGLILYTPEFLGGNNYSWLRLTKDEAMFENATSTKTATLDMIFGNATLTSFSSAENSQLIVDDDHIEMLTTATGGGTNYGITYTSSIKYANLQPRSLITKEYVDSVATAGGGGGSVPTKILRDTTNTSANTLIIDKVSGGIGTVYSHDKDDIRWSMYGGSYGSKFSGTNLGLEIIRGDNAITLSGGDGSTDGSALDFAGLRGSQSYWLSSFFTDNHFAQKGYVDAAITTAMSGGSVGTTTNALTAGTGLTSTGTFNGSTARTFSLATGAAVANLGFTPVSNVLSSGNIIVGNGSNVATPATMSGDATIDNTGAITLANGGLSRIQKTYTQSSHGFVAGDVLKKSGGVWAKAQANSATNAEVLGVVESVTTNTFRLVFAGEITLSGLTTETNYWLSSSSAGVTTTTEPTTTGTVSKPVYYSISTTTAVVQIQRGVIN